MAELCDGIDVARVSEILDEIGYDIGSGPSAQTAHRRLAAWYVAGQPISAEELREWLASQAKAEKGKSEAIVDELAAILTDGS